jgi:hypothetical protein
LPLQTSALFLFALDNGNEPRAAITGKKGECYMGEWPGRDKQANEWARIQELARSQLDKALRVHSLGPHKILFPRGNGQLRSSKVWQVVNPATGAVLLHGVVYLAKGAINMRVIVEELLSGHLGIGKANARQLYDSNEAIADAAIRRPGRPKGAKGKKTIATERNHLNEARGGQRKRQRAARKDADYRKQVSAAKPKNQWKLNPAVESATGGLTDEK